LYAIGARRTAMSKSDVNDQRPGASYPLNVFDKSRFRDVPEELDAVIDNSFGYAANHIPLGEIGKFADFDNIGHDA
jgi:hypothetical protein